MKKLISSILFLASFSSNSFALTFSELEGTYKLTSKFAPGVQSRISIDREGNIDLVEKTRIFICQGKSVIIDQKILADIKCENGFENLFRIDLTNVTNLNSFNAPIQSKATGEFVWKFKRIR